MTENSTSSRSPRLPQVLGRLGLYATYVAAALVLLVIAGDLNVLLRRPPVLGLLAVLVAVGPLVAMLLSTFASYVNYYGTWRIMRGQDEYDAGEDLKSHAADAPQALQAWLAGRRGCLPAVSVALLCTSLLLAGAANVPPSTPGIGPLGTWKNHIGVAVAVAPTPTAIPTAAATAIPTATARPVPTATATTVPRATATATPIPPVINFSVTPRAYTWTGCPDNPIAVTLTLDNSKSTVAVSWQATAVQSLPTGAPWATITPVSSGTVAARSTKNITVTPNSALCRYSSPNGTNWTVRVTTTNAGSPTFTYTTF